MSSLEGGFFGELDPRREKGRSHVDDKAEGLKQHKQNRPQSFTRNNNSKVFIISQKRIHTVGNDTQTKETNQARLIIVYCQFYFQNQEWQPLEKN